MSNPLQICKAKNLSLAYFVTDFSIRYKFVTTYIRYKFYNYYIRYKFITNIWRRISAFFVSNLVTKKSLLQKIRYKYGYKTVIIFIL